MQVGLALHNYTLSHVCLALAPGYVTCCLETVCTSCAAICALQLVSQYSLDDSYTQTCQRLRSIPSDVTCLTDCSMTCWIIAVQFRNLFKTQGLHFV